VRVCVFGAGAIGGLVAVKLAAAGEDVTVVARGAHLAAIRERGLRLLEKGEGGETAARVRATDRAVDAGPQDLIVLGVKAHQLPPVIGEVGALVGPATVVLTAQNGIPWWYFARHGGPYEGHRLESVDPGGVIARTLDVRRVIGSVVYPAAELAGPGVVRHVEGNRITVGELDGAETERVKGIAALLRRAGFRARVASDLRAELWVKLWGNLSFNPVSALTHATLAEIAGYPPARELAAAMMREAQAVGEKLGVRFGVQVERRIAGAEAVGAHRTSMLQDVEAGRPTELDALLGSVVELGRITGTPTPNLDAVHALASLLERTLRAAGARLALEPVPRPR
jgi:2-dehydropantoate 2-reductase